MNFAMESYGPHKVKTVMTLVNPYTKISTCTHEIYGGHRKKPLELDDSVTCSRAILRLKPNGDKAKNSKV